MTELRPEETDRSQDPGDDELVARALDLSEAEREALREVLSHFREARRELMPLRRELARETRQFGERVRRLEAGPRGGRMGPGGQAWRGVPLRGGPGRGGFWQRGPRRGGPGDH